VHYKDKSHDAKTKDEQEGNKVPAKVEGIVINGSFIGLTE
jgi:hypothetical protein